MDKAKSKMQIFNPIKIIEYCYLTLFFLLPLVFFSKTSELFEFNKIILLYIFTIVITLAYSVTCVVQKKLIFKKTILTVPLLFFLLSQFLSTLTSSDIRTSFFGYYSRWNGGLLSLICFSLLYFIYVTVSTSEWNRKLSKIIIISTVIIAIWGVLEHFGYSFSCLIIAKKFSVDCWVQDVSLRVFSTFGQPNWLAAWLVAVIPISWVGYIHKKNIWYLLASLLFITTLIFTKSKSGLLAFAVIDIIFWGSLLVTNKFSKVKLNLIATHLLVLFIVVLFGSPWSPTLNDFLSNNKSISQENTTQTTQTSLETGGTDSGVIRQIVWKGAVGVWLQYPIFGSGVETFASSYYLARPVEHNSVSEWNFLYNKAHNEYLNFLATTGIVGLTTYILLIMFSLYQMFRQINKDNKVFQIALIAGFVSILITNFFGFSVVGISLLFFMFPALSVSTNNKENEILTGKITLDLNVKLVASILILLSGILLFFVLNYWRADYLYARSISEKQQGKYNASLSDISLAYNINKEPTYLMEHIDQLTDIASSEEAQKDTVFIETLVKQIDELLTIAEKENQMNVKILKQVANNYDDIGDINPKYYPRVLSVLEKLNRLAPTDPSIYYQEGLTYAKMDDVTALTYINKAIDLKPNYKIARHLLAYLYENEKDYEKAKEQLNFILKYISPDDIKIQEELKKISNN